MARHGCGGARGARGIAALGISWMLVGISTGAADQVGGAGQTVYELEAAVVVTFARFVEWSPQRFASASAPIVVGILDDEDVALALETIARGKNIAGRSMAVKRLQWNSDFSDVHVLFFGETAKRHLTVVLKQIQPQPIVTVSHLPDFGRLGGMITLTLTDGRISFAVNSSATAQSGVRLSSFLLSHATKVSNQSSGGVQ